MEDDGSTKAARVGAPEDDHHRLLADNANDVVWTMALTGEVTYVSPSIERVRGITPAEAKAQALDEIHPPSSAAKNLAYFERLFAAMSDGTAPPTFRDEMEYYRKDGSIMWGEVHVVPQLDDSGQVAWLLGVTRDISERKAVEVELRAARDQLAAANAALASANSTLEAANARLHRLAVTDELTGLWNRRHAVAAAAELVARRDRDGTTPSLVWLDLDHFKSVNDRHGHLAGDRLLSATGALLRDRLRNVDVAARWGGEEFLVLLPETDLSGAVAVADDLRRSIEVAPAETFLGVTCSAGVSELRPDEDLDAWLARADQALYAAKQGGRNAVCAVPAVGPD